MSLVFNTPIQGPSTHALVIGVGHYPNKGWGVGDLDSAAQSAVAFARWLEKSWPRAGPWPLSTIDLRVSVRAGPLTLGAPPGTPVDPATTVGVFTAITDWFKRCHTDENNLAILYFAGHGVEKGLVASLLTADFGGNQLDVGDDALNLSQFAVGMERCRARKQWFIVDACRITPPGLISSLGQFGRPGIAPDADDRPSGLERDHLILQATAAERVAYGTDGEPSRFTRALIRALDGAAWDDDNQPWISWAVRSERLVTTINHLLQIEERLHGAPSQRARVRGDSGGFVLWQPNRSPRVPVIVSCNPPHRMHEASLAVERDGVDYGQRGAGDPDPWEFDLDAAASPYTVNATFPSSKLVANEVLVRPPSKEAGVQAP
ncbi:MAG: caspase family protein [bacterium]